MMEAFSQSTFPFPRKLYFIWSWPKATSTVSISSHFSLFPIFLKELIFSWHGETTLCFRVPYHPVFSFHTPPLIIFNAIQILQLCCFIPKNFRNLLVLNPRPYYLLRTLRKVFISKSSGEEFPCDSTPLTSLQDPSNLCSDPEHCGMCAPHLAQSMSSLTFFHTLPSFICKSWSSMLNSLSLYMLSYGSHVELQNLHRIHKKQELTRNH